MKKQGIEYFTKGVIRDNKEIEKTGLTPHFINISGNGYRYLGNPHMMLRDASTEQTDDKQTLDIVSNLFDGVIKDNKKTTMLNVDQTLRAVKAFKSLGYPEVKLCFGNGKLIFTRESYTQNKNPDLITTEISYKHDTNFQFEVLFNVNYLTQTLTSFKKDGAKEVKVYINTKLNNKRPLMLESEDTQALITPMIIR